MKVTVFVIVILPLIVFLVFSSYLRIDLGYSLFTLSIMILLAALAAFFATTLFYPRAVSLLREIKYFAIIAISPAIFISSELYSDWNNFEKYNEKYSYIDYVKLSLGSKIGISFNTTKEDKGERQLDYNTLINLYKNYQNTGEIHPDITPYISNKKRFKELLDISMIRFYPGKNSQNLSNYDTNFGQRIFAFKNFCGQNKDFIAARSTMGSDRVFAKLFRVDPFEKIGRIIDRSLESSTQIFDAENVITADYVPRTFGVNSMDINVDGATDIIVQDRVIFGGQCHYYKALDQFPYIQVSGEKVFVQTEGDKFLLHHDRLRWPTKLLLSRLEFQRGRSPSLVKVATIPIEKSLGPLSTTLGPGILTPHYSLVPVADFDADGLKDIVVTYAKGFEIRLSKFNYMRGIPITFSKIRENFAGSGFFLIGAVGDIDGDDLSDFWIFFAIGDKRLAVPILQRKVQGKVFRGEAIDLVDVIGPIYLFEDLDKQFEEVFLGSTISNTLGDFNRDGIPDLSYTSHYESALSGTLYVLSGAIIREHILDKVSRVHIKSVKCGIARYRAPLSSNLAAKPAHFSGRDIDGDGVTDIVISPDKDIISDPMTGSVLLVDGKLIGFDLAC